MINQVTIYTDGACKGNPGPGGYAALLHTAGRSDTHEKLVSGRETTSTTNNRMELRAAIAGLTALKRPCQVTLLTDSTYVIKVATGSNAKKNRDLVNRLRQLAAQHNVTFTHIRGHSNHPHNDRVDTEARRQATQAQREQQI